MMSEYREASGNRERNMRHSSQFRLLLENLLNLQVDFEIGDENLMRRFAAVENGRIRLGNCAYDWVFVADSDYNRSSTMKLLQTFAKQGGRLAYVNSIPDGAEENTADWPGTKLVQNRRDMLDKYLRYAGFPRTLTLLNPRTLTVASGLAVHVRRVENRLRDPCLEYELRPVLPRGSRGEGRPGGFPADPGGRLGDAAPHPRRQPKRPMCRCAWPVGRICCWKRARPPNRRCFLPFGPSTAWKRHRFP